MYAPKQYRPEKKRPTVNFLALPEVEPRNPVVAAPPVYAVIVEEKENAEAAKQGKEEAKSIAQNKLSTDNGSAQPTPKKDAIRTENPPQFKMANDGPFQYKLQAPTQRKSGANAKAGGKSATVDLPSELLLNLERLFGLSFSDVKVHANSPEATQAGALAFAQGSDIHFAPGQYNPTSPAGLALIGHEMAHIVQQRQGRVRPTTEIDGRPVNAEVALEQEADRIGALVANGAGGGSEKTMTSLAPPTVATAQFKSITPQAPEAATEKQNEETEDNFLGLEESDHTLRFADLQENRDFDKAIDADVKAAAEENGQPQQMKLATAQFARTEAAAPAVEAAAGAPATVVDISHGFNPPKDVADYLNENAKKSMEINAKMGTMAKGKIKVKQTTKKVEGGATEAEYKIDTGQYLEYIGDVGFLEPLRAQGLLPVIALKASDPKAITGVLTLKTGETVLPEPKSLIQQINANLEALGILGVEQLQVPTYTNEVIEGVLTLMAPELSTQIGGFLNASGTFGMVGNTFVFSLHADIDIKGMATGALDIARDETGKYNGTAEIGIAIENVTGNVKVIYADGKVTGRGEGGIASDKFKGTLTLIFDEKSIADQAVHEGMGLNMMEEAEGQAPASKGDGPRVVAGFGSVEVQLTPWLSATATVGIDSEGHVTIHGTMAFPDQIELMEQKDKKTDLFNLEIKAGYGVPLVGQIFLFASIGMFVKAGFGPLALHDIGMEGTYSTDPKVLNNFKITGALGISAYAQVGLSVKAGAGLTLLGHDIKAGIDLTASAGLKAYAEARPTFEYLEKDTGGQKVGEAHLKGHFEAAAQLFLELAGAFFVDLDSPWWSPVPDNHWEWPFGSMTMPIGDSMGVGADVDWLVGSPDVPELTFSPVQFDPDKFMSDMTKDPSNVGQKGGKGGDKDEKGTWKGDGDASASDKTVDPKLGPVKDDKKKEPKEDLTKLPDHERYMRGLDEIGKVGEASKGKPLGKGAVAKKIRDIKSKYALNTVNQKNAKDDSVEIYVKHKDEDNTKNMIEVKLLSKAELDKQFAEAVADLEKGLKTLGHPETGAISESAAKTIAHEIDLAHEVIDGTHVTVDGDHVVIKGDLGSEHRVMATKPLAKGMDGDVKDGPQVEDHRTMEQKQHDLDAGLAEAEAASKKKNHSVEEIKALLPAIKAKHKMQYLNLVVDSHKPLEDAIHFEGKVNPEKITGEIYLRHKADFEKVLFEAMKELGNENLGSHTKKEYTNQSTYTNAEANITHTGNTAQDDALVIAELKKSKEAAIAHEAETVQKSIKTSRIHYTAAAQAKVYANNVFSVNGHRFFVDQLNNNYIYPEVEVQSTGNGVGYYDFAANYREKNPLVANVNPGDLPPSTARIKIAPMDHQACAGKFSYDKIPVKVSDQAAILADYPNKISADQISTLFLAAMLAEPSRHSVAAISNLLVMANKDSKNQDAPAFTDSDTETAKFSMTRGGTDPNPGQYPAYLQNKTKRAPALNGGDPEEIVKDPMNPSGNSKKRKNIQKDQDSDDRRNAKLAPDPNLSAGHIPKTVTDRDIKAAVTNEHLLKQLESDFEPFATTVEENKAALVLLFKTHIKDFLGI